MQFRIYIWEFIASMSIQFFGVPSIMYFRSKILIFISVRLDNSSFAWEQQTEANNERSHFISGWNPLSVILSLCRTEQKKKKKKVFQPFHNHPLCVFFPLLCYKRHFIVQVSLKDHQNEFWPVWSSLFFMYDFIPESDHLEVKAFLRHLGTSDETLLTHFHLLFRHCWTRVLCLISAVYFIWLTPKCFACMWLNPCQAQLLFGHLIYFFFLYIYSGFSLMSLSVLLKGKSQC